LSTERQLLSFGDGFFSTVNALQQKAIGLDTIDIE